MGIDDIRKRAAEHPPTKMSDVQRKLDECEIKFGVVHPNGDLSAHNSLGEFKGFLKDMFKEDSAIKDIYEQETYPITRYLKECLFGLTVDCKGHQNFIPLCFHSDKIFNEWEKQ